MLRREKDMHCSGPSPNRPEARRHHGGTLFRARMREAPLAQPRAARQLVHSADHGENGEVGDTRRPEAIRRRRDDTSPS